MSKKYIMAVCAHADDIEIKAGGTFLKYHDLGYEVIYVMATNNMSGCDARISPIHGEAPIPPQECFEIRRKEARAAAKILGTEPIFLDYPQGAFNKDGIFKGEELRYGSEPPAGIDCDCPSILTAYKNRDCVQKITDIILDKKPEFIFTEGADHNTEHYATCLLTMSAVDQAQKEGYRGLLFAPALPRRPFVISPDTFVDITDYVDRKIELLKLHESQCGDWMLERLKDRGKFWGYAANCKYAEAFVVVKNALLF